MKILKVVLLISISGIISCGTNPNKIQVTHIYLNRYETYTCDEYVKEINFVSTEMVNLYDNLKNKINNVKTGAGVGMFATMPFCDVDKEEADMYSRLSGKYNALKLSALRKQCDMNKFPLSPQETIEQKYGKKGT